MTDPVSRREFLLLGGFGVLATAVGTGGLLRVAASGAGSRITPVPGAAWRAPDVLTSSMGVLTARLEAARTQHQVAGRTVTALGYNGGSPGPTLRVRPGDRLQLKLVNQLDAPTNLHVHGLRVSPSGNGDNVFLRVDPGSSFDYAHQLPVDHPPGVYWYHPHVHTRVAEQVFGGLFGAIVVEDPAASAVPADRDEVMVVSDITVDSSGAVAGASAHQRMLGREGDLVLVNGQFRPVMTARPGQRLRWRVVNACASRYLRLRLDGQQMALLGLDSGRTAVAQDVAEVVLAPGNRADLFVTATSGRRELRSLSYDRGTTMMGATSGSVVLATLEVAGNAGPALPAVPRQPVPGDLRGRPVAARRTLTFAMGMGMGGMGMGGMGGGGMGGGGMVATIDGAVFDPQRVDQAPQAGTVEEWTLRNTSGLNHPVHLHVWPMQVVDRAGAAVEGVVVRDVVDVPAGGTVTVRIAFTGPVGRTVYHCHILDHEDSGMMGVVEVR